MTATTSGSVGVAIDVRVDEGIRFSSHHDASTWGPVTGWVATTSPVSLGITFFAGHLPTLGAQIGDTPVTVDEMLGGHARADVSLEPGVNLVSFMIHGESDTTSFEIPITYIDGATVRLARIVAMDDTSVTLDYGYWSMRPSVPKPDDDQDGEFPGPADDDPGVTESVAVSPDAYVILHETRVVDYQWFLDQYERQIPHNEIGWHPEYPDTTVYWATIDDGHLIELWHIPVG